MTNRLRRGGQCEGLPFALVVPFSPKGVIFGLDHFPWPRNHENSGHSHDILHAGLGPRQSAYPMATHTGPQGHLWRPWIISTSKGTRETVYTDILQIRAYIGYLYSFGIIGYLMYFGYSTILYGLESERDRPPRLRHILALVIHYLL